MLIDPRQLSRGESNDLVNGLVGPRPIAWVSTVGRDGSPNLAPFSYFNAFSASPFTVGISPGSRKGVNKDTLRNARETGEFVVNIVSEDLAERANVTSADVTANVNEWELAGLTRAASSVVAPPRIAEALAALECQVFQVVDLGPEETPTNSLVIARVTSVYVNDDALDGLRPRPEVLRLVGRMGGDLWVRTRDTFSLPRGAGANLSGSGAARS